MREAARRPSPSSSFSSGRRRCRRSLPFLLVLLPCRRVLGLREACCPEVEVERLLDELVQDVSGLVHHGAVKAQQEVYRFLPS